VTLGLGLSVAICTTVFTSLFPQEINTLDLQLHKGSGSETRVHVAKAAVMELDWRELAWIGGSL
jgi:hypothetical protein